jgi:hypothetical protein
VLIMMISHGYAEDDSPDDSITKVTFDGDVFGRSSMDFRNKSNIASLVPRGSEGDVLEVRRLRSGSYGVRVRITKVSKDKGKSTAKVNDEAWVYYSQKVPWLAFPDKKGVEMQDPEEALIKRSNVDNGVLPPETGSVADPALPNKKEILDTSKTDDPNLAKKADPATTEADACPTCSTGTLPAPANANQKDIKAVADAITAAPKKPKDPNDKWADDPVVSKYRSSKRTKKMIDYALRNKRSHSTKYCYRYVKRALVASDTVKKYPPGVYARNAVRDLKAQGMINMLDNPKYKAMIKGPQDVPKGAVIVYWNGTDEAGDVQIKTDDGAKGGYVSDFYSKTSFLSSPKAKYYAKIRKPYKIIGVMIKP